MASTWKAFLLALVLPVVFLFFTYHHVSSILNYFTSQRTTYDIPIQECPANFYPFNGSCVRCPIGQFSMSGWLACLTWLNCDNISHNVRIRKRIGKPGHLNAVKDVYLADWFGYNVVLSTCAHEMYEDDCMHGINMIQGLQGHDVVVQLIGVCYDNLEVCMYVLSSWLSPY